MENKSLNRITDFMGSVKALAFEGAIAIGTILIDLWFGTQKLFVWISVLCVLVLFIISLFFFQKKRRLKIAKSHREENNKKVLDVCLRLSDQLVEILVSAWDGKFTPQDEDIMYSFEEDNTLREIWTFTPNFEGVLGAKKSAIIENICCNGKKYRFIFPQNCHRQYDELLGACKSHHHGMGKSETNVEGRCLLGKQMTPIELVICWKNSHYHNPAEVYLYYNKASNDKGVLVLPDRPRRYKSDLAATFSQLWDLLPPEGDNSHHH